MTDTKLIFEDLEKKINEGRLSDLDNVKSAWDAYTMKTVLENTQEWLKSNARLLAEAAPVTKAQDIANFEKVFLPMVRRSMSQLVTPNIVGTQPLKGPNGAAFFLRARYTDANGEEALGLNPPNTAFTGKGSTGTVGTAAPSDLETNPFAADAAGTRRAGYTTGIGMSLAEAEGDIQATMTVTVDKINIGVQERQVRALVSLESQTDMRKVHGLNMIQEVENVMAAEIVREVDTQILRTMKIVAKDGAQDTNTPGIFNTAVDSDGRWFVEKVKGLINQINKESYKIFHETRRGAGNFLVVSAGVASALAAANVLDYQSGLIGKANIGKIDGPVYAGTLVNRFKVYIDPWPSAAEFVLVGYYGGPMDSGLIYAPYEPVVIARAKDPVSFADAIGYKTRYGLVQNPFVFDPNTGNAAGENMIPNNNQFYRIFEVQGL